MKKRVLGAILAFVISTLALTGCDVIVDNGNTNTETSNSSEVKLNFVARFYTNNGDVWLEAYGSDFDLKPNKVKEYGYNSDGTWESYWTTSSIVTCEIDGHQIDTCGSTVIFKDINLQPCDADFTNDDGIIIAKGEASESGSIDTQGLSVGDYYKIRLWWDKYSTNGGTPVSRLVVIQSQLGNLIEMYMGENVTWRENELPKTTYINIDGKEMYIHRANFSVIDTAILANNTDISVTK